MASEFLSTPQIQRYYFTQFVQARTVTDGATTNTSTTVTSATANFSSLDVGATIAGTGIPNGATISSVTNATTVVISSAATATGSSVSLTITRTATNAISGFQTALINDWGASGTVAQVLPSTFQVLTNSNNPTTAILLVNNSSVVLNVTPTQYVGYNYGNWQVLNASVMAGSQFTPASV